MIQYESTLVRRGLEFYPEATAIVRSKKPRSILVTFLPRHPLEFIALRGQRLPLHPFEGVAVDGMDRCSQIPYSYIYIKYIYTYTRV